MALAFDSPAWLLTLVAVAGMVVAALQVAGKRSRTWKLVAVALPGLAAACLGLALAGPIVTRQPLASHVVVLLDLSGSARESPWRQSAWVQALMKQHLPPETRVSVVCFAGRCQESLHAVRVGDPAPWPSWPTMGGEGADLQAALAWREGPEDRAPRWIITDGLLDMAALRQAAERFPIALTIVPPTAPDVGVADLQVREPTPPAATQAARPREVWARLQATGPARVRALVLRDGTELAGFDVAFSGPSSRLVNVTDREALDGARYEVRIVGRDPWPEDDAAAIIVPRLGPPAVLLVSAEATTRPALGKNVQIVTPELLPMDIASVATRQIVVLDEVSQGMLRPGGDVFLERFVRELGGGCLIIGGQRAFGPGDYPSGELERLSPLASSPPQRPPLQVVFLLDGSGSMGERVGSENPVRKFTLAGQGVQAAMRALRPDDQVRVIRFSSSAETLVQGNVADVAGKLVEMLERVRPDGATNPDAALPLLERDLQPGTLLVLLTDGEIPRMEVDRWVKMLTEAKGKLAIVAPRTGEFLPKIADAVNARWLATDAPQQWATLLRRAVEEQVLGQAMDRPLTWQAASTGAIHGTTRRWIQTWLKGGAMRRATGSGPQEGHIWDLAAVWQQGLGRVAAVCFADPGRDYQALIQSLMTDITPPPGDRRFAVQARRVASQWQIETEGSESGAFLNDQKLTLRLMAGTTTDTPTFAVPQVAPGKYAVTLPRRIEAFAGVIVRQTPTGEELVARLNPALLPGREWPATGTIEDAPAEASIMRLAATGADMSTPWRPHLIERRYDPRPALWIVAACCLLAALWLRRSGH